jgi:DNA-binding transcriptional LysR family regulator
MLTSDDLRFFAAVAGAPSLAATARRLSVTAPAVSLRLRNLEERLGVRLIHRSSRRMTLTDEGVLLAEHAEHVLRSIDEVADLLSERRGVVRGHLRIAAPAGFGRRHVGPAIARFRADCPNVRVTLELSDHPIQLKPEAWDMVIHIGAAPSADLQMVTLAQNRRLLCASPDYIARNGKPGCPADLEHHSCLALQENDEDVTLWRFTRGAEQAAIRVSASLQCNDGEVLRNWGCGGLGVIVRSEWDVADDLRAGRLIRLLPEWESPDAPIIALLGSRDGRTARVRGFLDALRQHLSPPPWQAAKPHPASDISVAEQ